ncbi:hypothetical protein QTP88_029395 [Uroleucon formosanum]
MYRDDMLLSVIIGKLSSEECTKPIVLTVEQLQKANFQTISQLFNDSMSILWPEKIFHEKVLLYVTDAAPYMVKSGEALKVFYPKLIHVTCMAHGLHRVAEAIREKYQNVDRLISNSKKIFLKAPSRVNTFKDMYPNLSLPPQPILTRWGTWLEAAIYYGKYFNECLIDTITKLEKSNITLRNSVLLIENIKIKFEEGGPGIDFARSKFTNVLSKNREYSTLKKNQLYNQRRVNFYARWKHAEASIKIYTSSRDTKDLIILNKINDVVQEILDRISADPKKKMIKNTKK